MQFKNAAQQRKKTRAQIPCVLVCIIVPSFFFHRKAFLLVLSCQMENKLFLSSSMRRGYDHAEKKKRNTEKKVLETEEECALCL